MTTASAGSTSTTKPDPLSSSTHGSASTHLHGSASFADFATSSSASALHQQACPHRLAHRHLLHPHPSLCSLACYGCLGKRCGKGVCAVGCKGVDEKAVNSSEFYTLTSASFFTVTLNIPFPSPPFGSLQLSRPGPWRRGSAVVLKLGLGLEIASRSDASDRGYISSGRHQEDDESMEGDEDDVELMEPMDTGLLFTKGMESSIPATLKEPWWWPRRARSPRELLYEILAYLPTNSLIPLLRTRAPLSTVTSSELSTRLYSIRTLDDLKSFVRSGFATTAAPIGPLFYRAGTIVLFARYFMRLVPEAKALLGVGYAVPLPPRHHPLPHPSPENILSTPTVIANLVPSIPPHLVQRLRFEGPTPTLSPSDPPRCCGPAGSLATPIQDDDVDVSEQLGEPISGIQPQGDNTSPGSPPPQNWGLMSPYTPWHLYLLTYAVSHHTRVSKLPPQTFPTSSPLPPLEDQPSPDLRRRRPSKIAPPPSYEDLMASFNSFSASATASASTPMASAATALTIRLATPVVSVISLVVALFARQMVWTYVAVITYFAPGFSYILRPYAVVEDMEDDDIVDEPPVIDETPPHHHLLTATVIHGVTRLTLSRVSLAWWFRLHPIPTLRSLTLTRCEVDENGISIVAAACQGLLSLLLRHCEVRGGDGGWRSREASTQVGDVAGVYERSCGVDAVRMVLERAPRVERVEFVGCGGVEEGMLDLIADVEERIVKGGVVVRRPPVRVEDGGGVVPPVVVPPGFRKCYVVQGVAVRNLRSVWNAHLKARQRELWEGHV
ncbi:hypothetical protein BC829DRAFT_441302 [Chytridium lagenaria]|nr:hypothetical protein BC829DRAFT_441302 [Chytridium lagenaria]